MTRRLGDLQTFAIEVGEAIAPALRVMDLWAAGRLLTAHDNVAYVPFLYQCLRTTATQVRERDISPCPFPGRSAEDIFRLLQSDKTEFREQYWLMNWGEIVDNVARYAYLDDDLVLIFAFWRADHPVPEDLGKIFVARVDPDVFADTLGKAADLIGSG